MQHGGEFLGEHEQTAIACLLAHNADEAARGETRADDTILSPGAIHFGEEAGDLVPTGSLARLAGFADEHEEEVQGVTGGADHAVRAGANDVAKGGEQLQENGFGLGLGVRGQGAHGFSGETVERVSLEHGVAGVLGRTRGWREWFWGGQRRDWRRNRVGISGNACVLRRGVCLGKQLFPLLFYLCGGRGLGLGPGYAHPQVSNVHSSRLRLLVSDVSFHRERAVPWRDDPPGCLACMHA